ncbi:hypothetical protein CP061683_0639, partial [Chlamydia psittaci 06-1683]
TRICRSCMGVFSAGFGQTKKFLDTTAAKASNTRRNNQECIISYE